MENNEDQNVSENNEFETNIINELKNKDEEIAKLKDQLLRIAAEMENIRKRSIKQVEDASKYAVTSFTKDMINVLENLNRAIASVTEEHKQNEFVKNLLTGVEMTSKELINSFDKNKVTIISPKKGDDFDHNLHEAVANQPGNDLESGKIIDVLQNGYLLHERLIKPAMVVVSS